MDLTKASEDIQDGKEKCNLHQKSLGSVDERAGVICGSEQIWMKHRI